jgi:hypothetical protein
MKGKGTKKKDEFQFEYLYLENYDWYSPPPKQIQQKNDDHRGVVEIDLNNDQGKT